MLNKDFKQRVFEALQEIHAERSATLREHGLSVPFGDCIVDRWSRGRSLGFAAGANVYDCVIVRGTPRVGEMTWIGPFCILDAHGGLEIGSYCTIGAATHIYTHDTVRWALSGGAAAHELGSVRVGSRCYIGPRTTIVRGVEIGDGAVVGAHSFVNRSVPAGKKVAGCPAKIIGDAELREDSAYRSSARAQDRAHPRSPDNVASHGPW